eukprot:TRINITY_DN292_c0_g3_i1.p1 TRINITY_DN292_c0_g3~~TRINITY_DN292_c0_g3_i1.p1  ORF type:complete len:332 (-),score=94.76 TRINITY_DN292_c0_g3_i1:38-1033(-)
MEENNCKDVQITRVKRSESVHESPRKDTQRYYSNWIDEYDVLETIGEGCFGKVKLGVCKTTGEKVALKLIDHKLLSNTKIKEKFREEISVIKDLSHPNIVKLLKVIESPENEFTCLVFEYVSGGDLLDYVMNQKEGKLDELKSAKLFSQIVSSVQYLHDKGIAHRDLKLENIMVDPEGNVAKLIDFGLSKRVDGGQLLTTFCGSPTYAAPEILYKEPYHGNKVDVWSLGVILYSMLAGNIPWEGKNDIERIANVKKGAWLPDPALNQEVMDLLGRCFEMDPEVRANAFEIANHQWLINTLKPKVDTAGRTIQKMIRRLSVSLFNRETGRSE